MSHRTQDHSRSRQTHTTAISIPQLGGALNGRVIAPDDAGYDEARAVFYGGFDRRPEAIVRVADETDVSHVVSLARETGLELAVRSGATVTPAIAPRTVGSCSTCGT